jgi:hypothetical protein
MWRGWLAIALACCVSSSGSAPAAEDTHAEIGFLTCTIGGPAESPPAGDATMGGQARDLLCAFNPARSSNQETYVGMLQSVGDQDELLARGVLMWLVKATAATALSPGLLEQTYAVETAGTASAASPLIGETNRAIVLQSMNEKEGAATAGKQAQPRAGLILNVVLKLRSASA